MVGLILLLGVELCACMFDTILQTFYKWDNWELTLNWVETNINAKLVNLVTGDKLGHHIFWTVGIRDLSSGTLQAN